MDQTTEMKDSPCLKSLKHYNKYSKTTPPYRRFQCNPTSGRKEGIVQV